MKAGSPSGTPSPGMAAQGLPHQRPGPGRARQWVGPPSGLGSLSRPAWAVPGPGFEHAGGQPWLLHNQTAGSSGEGESCGAATADPSPLRNSRPPGSSECAGSSPSTLPLPATPMAENRLSEMPRSRSAALNKNALRHWFGLVGFFLTGSGQSPGPVFL